jgi:hypothetical protein
MKRALVTTTAVAAALAFASIARAEGESHADGNITTKLGVGAELGSGSMLSSYQRDTLHLDKGAQTSLLGTYQLNADFEAELAFRTWWFTVVNGTFARTTLIGPGVRYWLLFSAVGAAFADVDLGLGINGPSARFMFDVGGGYAFHMLGIVDFGAVLRYGQVVAAGSDPASAQFWSIGFIGIYRFGGTASAPAPAQEEPPREPAPASPAPAATPAPTEPSP